MNNHKNILKLKPRAVRSKFTLFNEEPANQYSYNTKTLVIRNKKKILKFVMNDQEAYDTLPKVDSSTSLRNSKNNSVDKSNSKSSDILLPLIYLGSYFDKTQKVDKHYSIGDRKHYSFHEN